MYNIIHIDTFINMQLHNLTKILTRSKKRLGRGLGSGKGKTSGKGQKGQKARGTVAIGFSGGGLPLYLKLPMLRGFGRGRRKVGSKTVVLDLNDLNSLKANTVVDIESLIKGGIVLEKQVRKYGLKVLSTGELNVPLEVRLPVSKAAEEKILKAGGKVG